MKPFLVVTALAAFTQIATAEPDKAAGKQRFAEGKTKYAAGDYRGAAEKFAAAYQADPDPAYLFNVGQAYRRSAEAKAGPIERDCQQAMLAYQQFLEQLPAATNRAEVEGYVKDMTACAGTLADSKPPPADKPPVDPPPPPPIDKPVAPASTTAPKSDPKRMLGVGVGAIGLIACGVGAYYLKVGADRAGDFDAAAKEANAEMDAAAKVAARDRALALEAEGKAANRNATIGLVVGGALVTGGVVLYVLGGKPSKESALSVVPSRDGAMAFGMFRF